MYDVDPPQRMTVEAQQDLPSEASQRTWDCPWTTCLSEVGMLSGGVSDVRDFQEGGLQ